MSREVHVRFWERAGVRSPRATRFDVFTVGTDGTVYSTWWDGASGWAGWFPLGIT